ncbi:epithelial sodium channel subunit alpha-like [Glandiceps talaboti]
MNGRFNTSTKVIALDGMTDDNIVTYNDGLGSTTAEKGEIKLKPIASALVENTTCHGIPRIYSASNFVRRAFWSLVFVSAVALFLWQFSKLLTNYYAYEVDVTFEIKFETNADFPAVTICNLNPFKNSKAQANQEILNLLSSNSTSRRRRNAARNKRSSSSNSNYTNWETMSLDYESFDSNFETMLFVYDTVASLNYSDRMLLGHEINDMLIDCTWKGYPCGPSNFTRFYNYMYGNCYTFNSGDSGSLVQTNKPGPLYGLSLKLYVEQDEYIHSIRESAGIRVLIHSQDVMPFPEDNGFSISPGQETNVGIRKLSISRQPYPYGECKDTETGINIFTEFFGVDYSQQACEKDCYLQHVIDQCGCVDYRFNYHNTYNVCRHGDATHATCIDRTEDDYNSGKLTPCSNFCTESCTETSYRTRVTSSLWPNKNYKPQIIQEVKQISSSLNTMVGMDSSFAENNLCKLNIYYEEFNFEAITESPKYEEEDLLSDLGGQLGLWIGMSFISVFEFLEFCYDVCRWLHYKLSNRSRIRNTSIN